MKGIAVVLIIFVLAVSVLGDQNNIDETTRPIDKASQARSIGAFPDVTPSHWGYEAVNQLADLGVIKGYPDGKFHGDKYVTRFELAIVLTRLVEAVNAALMPEQNKDLLEDDTPVLQGESGADAEKNPREWLVRKGFIHEKSPIVRDPNKPATTEDVSTAFASVVARILEMRIPSDHLSPNTLYHPEVE